MKGKGKGKDQMNSRDCSMQYPDFTSVDRTESCTNPPKKKMKGKGKGKDQVNVRDCVSQFSDFMSVDQTEPYPMYSSILEQKDDRDLDIKDMDSLQCDLEQMLLSVTNRSSKLEEEMKSLLACQEMKNKRTLNEDVGSSNKNAPKSKRSKKSEENIQSHSSASKRPKSKNVQQGRAQDYSLLDSHAALPKNQRNDAPPSRFWESLKPYSADITPDHLKFLEEWIKPKVEDDEDHKIPPQGKHFTCEWSSRIVQDEQKEGVKASGKRKGLSNSSSLNSVDAEKIVKKIKDDDEPEQHCPFGPLTQRLVSCLMEKNIMTPLEDTIDSTKDLPKADIDRNNGNIIKSLNLGDTIDLEKRIRRGLEVAGILEPDEMDAGEESPDDDVLSELKRVQASLRSVAKYNFSLKQKLLKLAKEEVARQELRRKLDIIDAEIMNIQNKMKVAQNNKSTLTKKERMQAWELLDERSNLLKQIESSEDLLKQIESGQES